MCKSGHEHLWRKRDAMKFNVAISNSSISGLVAAAAAAAAGGGGGGLVAVGNAAAHHWLHTT